ncbi:MAG: hypothetical protein QOF42_641, partial [Gammaproteobacteria bacterium]|nr:hypothetical protein [Gammaproteobacteria bacterium]
MCADVVKRSLRDMLRDIVRVMMLLHSRKSSATLFR